MMRLAFLAVALMMFSSPRPCLAQEAVPRVWVASPWQHVLKTTAPSLSSSVSIRATRNEYEPFRIIVTAGDAPLTNVGVAASTLSGDSGEIAADSITLFREHYLNIYEPSHRSTAEPGWYPDPLIPFMDPTTGEDIVGARYDAVPFDVASGCNQGVWVDVYVPRDAPAGRYQGTVSITADGQPLAEVPVTLTVSDFALPDTIALRSWFGTWGLAGFLDMDPGSPEFARVQDLYVDALLAHRCIPSDLGGVWPAWSPEGGIDDSETGERLRTMIEDKHVNCLTVPFWWESPCLDRCVAYLHDLDAYLSDHGWLDLALVYLKDEPNSAEDYDLVRQQATVLDDNAPGIKRLCTEQTIPSDPAWGDLYGYVDIWCPLWGLYDEPTAQERQALGEEIWSYTALCQMDAANPFWEVDFPPIVYRGPFWTSWHYDIKGFLYWSTIYWQEGQDIWNSPDFLHWDLHFWGEGILLYPGADAGIEGPAPSIRLKLIREGIEDFEYFALASALGNAEDVDSIVEEIARSFTDWERDPEAYLHARKQLASLISSSPFPDVPFDHWAWESVLACTESAIVAGYPDGLYHPTDSVTRDQMAVFISRAHAGGDDNIPAGPAEPTFNDVLDDYWAYKQIEYCLANGIVEGYDPTSYAPSLPVLRDQMAVFIARTRGWVGIDDDMTTAQEVFPDVPAGYWCGTAIQACVDNGVVKGYLDGSYHPDASVTRDQMAVYITRGFRLPI
jgi:hypothetical protein